MLWLRLKKIDSDGKVKAIHDLKWSEISGIKYDPATMNINGLYVMRELHQYTYVNMKNDRASVMFSDFKAKTLKELEAKLLCAGHIYDDGF